MKDEQGTVMQEEVKELVVVKKDLMASEEDLIIYLKMIYSTLQRNTIRAYYLIGSAVNNFYVKKYGKSELEKIAESLDTGYGTIQKATEFASMYDEEQVMKLLCGKFVLSWHNVANNLSIPSDQFVKAYIEADTQNEFRNTVTFLKTKNRKVKQVDESDLAEPSFENESDPEKKQLKLKIWQQQQTINGLKKRAIGRNARITMLKDEVRSVRGENKSLKLTFKLLKKELKGRDDLLRNTNIRISMFGRDRFSTGEKRTKPKKFFETQFPSEETETPEVVMTINPYQVDTEPEEWRFIVK